MKKHVGVERLKSRYGLAFVTPFIVGLIVFFVIPLFKSVQYTFCDTALTVEGIKLTFTGLTNIRYALFEDPDFTNNLTSGILQFLYSFPMTLVISLIMAVILAQNFKGRIIFRGISFMTVIISSGVVMEYILKMRGTDVATAGVDTSLIDNMIDINGILNVVGLPSQIAEYFEAVLNSIMTIIWNSGIQTLLFISGLQSIPDQMYEVSKVEGATKWEEFWFITFPMLSRITILVAAFTAVELFTSKTDKVISSAYVMMQSQYYGQSSAILWIYFLIIGGLMGIIFLAFNRFCVRHWE